MVKVPPTTPYTATEPMSHRGVTTLIFLCCRDDRLRSLRVKMNFHSLACTIIVIKENEMTAKRKMIITMNTIGFSGAICCTKYAMICHAMTRIDTPIAVCFLLLLFAVEIPTKEKIIVKLKTVPMFEIQIKLE